MASWENIVNLMKRAILEGQKLLQQVRQPKDRRLAVFVRALRRYHRHHALQSAAAASFFSIFSLFPLLIFIVVVASYFIDPAKVEDRIVFFLSSALPVMPQALISEVEALINTTITRLANQRFSASVIALAGALWSASGVFNTIVMSVNHAWNQRNTRSVVQSRVIALAAIFSLIVIILLSLFLPSLFFWIYQSRLLPEIAALVSFAPFLLQLLLLFALYRLGPATPVRGRTALWVAVIVSLGLEVFRRVFAFFLRTGLAHYESLYGSLGVVIALLLWIYYSLWILLFGAYLAEAADFLYKPQPVSSETAP
mgnify:CR=1 FL=1